MDKTSDLFVVDFRIFHHLINKHLLQLCLEGGLKCPRRCSFQNFLSHSPKLQVAKLFDDRRLQFRYQPLLADKLELGVL